LEGEAADERRDYPVRCRRGERDKPQNARHRNERGLLAPRQEKSDRDAREERQRPD
jgi:hypothetical protein